MIDHLIRCAGQAEAEALVEQYGGSIAFQPRVVLQDGEWNEEGEVITSEITASGYHVWIVLDELDESLRDLPGDACRLIGDRSLCREEATFEDVLLYYAPDIDNTVLSSARVEPVPAGTKYPWRKLP